MGRSDREGVSGKGSGGDVFRKFHVQLLLKSSESQRERERENESTRKRIERFMALFVVVVKREHLTYSRAVYSSHFPKRHTLANF
tara:strand:- start:18 stop:272 length:255 start_codon:yes stop_codon:yes gene_type:complete